MKNTLFFALLSFIALSVPINAQREKGDKGEGERLLRVSDINGRATMLVKPVVPVDTVISGADGTTISLKVVIDGSGNVVSAICSLSCHPELKGLAEAAAKSSKFEPLIVDGEAVRYQGSLLYPIAMGRVNWYGFGLALRSMQIFDNTSVSAAAGLLTSEYGEERSRLQALDQDADHAARIKTIEDVIGAIRNRLTGKNVWLFNLGLAMRRVTALLNTPKIDRAELQRGIAEMGPLSATAPVDLSPEFLDKIKAISQFRVSPEMNDNDLRTAVFKLTLIRDEPK